MAVTTFAAVDIGSYDVTLEVFEISKKNGIHCIDKIRHRLELGRGSFTDGKIPPDMVDELCSVLSDFRKIMKGYRVDAYSVIATSALREAQNDLFILGKIRQTTGLDVRILSNSEQRFLSYKAIASVESSLFEEMIRKGTAVVDLDGGSIQLSLFDKSELITTQNLRMGSLRIRERLQDAMAKTSNFDELVEQLIHHDLPSFKKMYLKDRKIENVILNGDFITELIFKDPKHRDRSTRMVSRADFGKWYQRIVGKSVTDLAIENRIPVEYASLLRPSAIICHRIVEEMDASQIWMPGTHLSRGLAYEYAEKMHLLKAKHDFGNDIVTSARYLAKRYDVSKPHTLNMDMTATAIFDAMKPLHGMDEKERLMLRVAVMLHDVGKYISYNLIGESSYNIIMANEIIGLSHTEREIIAVAARYMADPLPEYEKIVLESSLDRLRYLKTAAFTAIIRLANALDRSHLQKVRKIDCRLKDDKLQIKLEIREDFSLETGLIDEEAAFFTEVFGVQPIIIAKRIA